MSQQFPCHSTQSNQSLIRCMSFKPKGPILWANLPHFPSCLTFHGDFNGSKVLSTRVIFSMTTWKLYADFYNGFKCFRYVVWLHNWFEEVGHQQHYAMNSVQFPRCWIQRTCITEWQRLLRFPYNKHLTLLPNFLINPTLDRRLRVLIEGDRLPSSNPPNFAVTQAK